MLARAITVLALALILSAPATAVEIRSSSQPAVLRISGTGGGLGVIRLLAEAFAQTDRGVRVELLPNLGSSGAIRAVQEGALDIGISARTLTPEERAQGLVERPVARTPLVLAVGPGAEATAVTLQELAGMYRGERTTWPGGERIRVILRPRNDADTAALRTLSPELAAAVDAALGRQGMLMATTGQDCAAMLTRTRGSIGPVALAQLVSEGSGLRRLALGGIAPTLENLGSGAYPLFHTLSVVVRARPSAEVRRFLAFLQTPEAGSILRRGGALPLAFDPPE